MPYIQCACTDFFGSVQAADNGDRANIPGVTAEEGGLPRVRGVGCGGVAAGALSDPARHGEVGTGKVTLPPPRGGPNLPDLFPETYVAAPFPGGGVTERGLESDQPLCSLCALPHAGHNIDHRGEEPTVPQVPPA